MPDHRELLRRIGAADRGFECCSVNSPHGLFYQDRDLRYRWVMREIGPFSRERLDGRTDFDVFPADQAMTLTRAKRWVLHNRTDTAVELRIPLADGEHRYEMIIQPWVDAAGAVLGVVVYARDVTQPRLIQEALQGQFQEFSRIFDAFDVIVYVSDMQTHELLYLNARARALVGRDAVGERCYEALQRGQMGQCTFCTNHLLVQEGVVLPPHRWEFQNTRTGEWFLCIDQAIQWTDGRLVRLEVAVDISDRKRTEMFREQYIGIISHDLRNPLNVVSMACAELQDALQGQGMDAETAVVEQMTRNVRQMNAMIDDLAESARLEAGELRLRLLPLQLGEVVRNLVQGMPRVGGGDRIRVSVGDESAPVLGDRPRIERIFQNLLSNALKYSPGEESVEVSIQPLEGVVQATVTDRGSGIDSQDRARIFERFYRTECAKATDGLGLGLYITRMLVEAHGGTIGVDSEVGRGTQFRVTLPLAPAV
jgi:two-component system, OmpR family, phosphate regulon sensor histidine kinase PhoR